FEKRLYVFKQHFGRYVYLSVNEHRGVLKVFPEGLPNKITYKYKEMNLKGNLPIVCGRNLSGKIKYFDMVKDPHLLIAGETGSGKSSAIRSILTSLIQYKSSKELKLILGDLKRSEFHLFKDIAHVEGVYHSADTLRPVLNKVKKEMAKRGDLLDEEGVNAIDQLPKKLPYIIVCIDEVVLLKKEKDIMDILEDISSIGRSLGVFIILSMQRPDAKLLDGKLKVNMTVRMGFKTQDNVNSKIIGTPGSEKLKTSGRMILKVNSDLQEIQCPWLDNEKAKKILIPYKVEKKDKQEEKKDDYDTLMELLKNE
ncbi:FtsK/SpoIIIE domain-containing protein, partial [Microbulbifer pacificus]|uniref:FtsK/SpoIIIE domain-containing protein n=1 Tax=Microbulbifer pacificus TaxID=407164 RepID=UPI001F2F970F